MLIIIDNYIVDRQISAKLKKQTCLEYIRAYILHETGIDFIRNHPNIAILLQLKIKSVY